VRDGNDEADADLVRAHLSRSVEDVEPRPDALPRLLAATRRRPARRPVFKTAGAALAATAAVLVALVVLPEWRPGPPAPVSIRPNSYVAQREPGVLASFDVASGHQLHRLARVSGRPADALAADGQRVYAVARARDGLQIVEVAPNGAKRVVREVPPEARPTALAAGGGRVAYADRDAVVVVLGTRQQRVPLPAGSAVRDLAVGSDGRLAVLTGKPADDRGELRVLPPGATRMSEPLAGGTSDCGPRAVAWSGPDIAALSPVRCGSPRVRVQILSPEGSRIGAGTPFETGPAPLGEGVRLSADRVGRFLVSAPDSRQWLVDGSGARAVPPACAPDGSCGGGAATFWG
jgi:hypothetical protein